MVKVNKIIKCNNEIKISMFFKCWLSETFFKILWTNECFVLFTQWVVNMELLKCLFQKGLKGCFEKNHKAKL